MTILLFSCQPQVITEEDFEEEEQGESKLRNHEPGDFEIVVIDGCQYLIFTENFNHAQAGYGFMAHKGNCFNSIHYNNQTN